MSPSYPLQTVLRPLGPAHRLFTRLPRLWFPLFVAAEGVVLCAFWALLRLRFSPKNYISTDVGLGTTEFAWLGVLLVCGVAATVLLWDQAELCRAVVCGLVPLCAVALFIDWSAMTGRGSSYVELLLFGTACGWSVPLGMRAWRRGLRASGGGDRPSAPNSGAGDAVPAGRRSARGWGWLGWALLLGYGVYFYCQQAGYLNNLALGFADCGQMARLMHNTLHNSPEYFLRDYPDKPMFFDHFQPGVLPFIPLWWLWPSMGLVIVFQVVAVLGVAVPLYVIGFAVLKDRVSACLLAAAWLVYPSASQLVYNGSYGFRWGSFCLLLYFVSLACWLCRRPGWALAAAVWAILIKEEAAVVVGMFGVYLAAFGGKRRAGLLIAACSFAYFLLVSSLLIPALHDGTYIVQGYFSGLGDTKFDILLSPIRRPGVFWGRLFSLQSLLFGSTLLAPLLFVPLGRPRVLTAGGVVFVFVCLWDKILAKSICFQYQAGVLPALFLALAYSLGSERRWRPFGGGRAVLAGTVLAGIVFSIFVGSTFWSKANAAIQELPGRSALVRRMKARIDPEAALVATQRAGAHFLTQRMLHIAADRVPSGVDHVLLDLRERWHPHLTAQGEVKALWELQRRVEGHPGLRLIDASDGLLLYSTRGAALDARAVVETAAPPPGLTPLDAEIGHGVRIVGFRLGCERLPRRGRIETATVQVCSRAERRPGADLALALVLRFNAGTPREESFVSGTQPLGQGIWPTYRWEPGRFYLDEFRVPLPGGLFNQRPSLFPLCTVLSAQE